MLATAFSLLSGKKTLAISAAAFIAGGFITGSYYKNKLKQLEIDQLVSAAEAREAIQQERDKILAAARAADEKVIDQLSKNVEEIAGKSQKVIREIRNVPVNTECNIPESIVRLLAAQAEAANSGSSRNTEAPESFVTDAD